MTIIHVEALFMLITCPAEINHQVLFTPCAAVSGFFAAKKKPFGDGENFSCGKIRFGKEKNFHIFNDYRCFEIYLVENMLIQYED